MARRPIDSWVHDTETEVVPAPINEAHPRAANQAPAGRELDAVRPRRSELRSMPRSRPFSLPDSGPAARVSNSTACALEPDVIPNPSTQPAPAGACRAPPSSRWMDRSPRGARVAETATAIADSTRRIRPRPARKMQSPSSLREPPDAL